MLRSGRQRNRGSISGTGKRIALTPRFRIGSGSTKVPINGHRGFPPRSSGIKLSGREANHFSQVRRLRMSGAVLPFPHMVSSHALLEV